MVLSKLILAKCGGLPKVIAAIKKYVSYRVCDIDKTMRRLQYLDTDFMVKLETDEQFLCLRGLFSWMESYFDACSDFLKPCIFYLSVFPLGHNIRWQRLLRRWIAEGYSRYRSGSTAEENGETLFSELVKLSIIQLQSRVNKVCQVNGFFLEYIISRRMEDNLVFALEDCCTLNSQLAGQHLTVRSNWVRDKNLFENIDFSRLRSLTVFGEWMPFIISPSVDMRLIRVLDLEDTTGVTDSDLEKIGKAFSRLKFLSVRGCKEIRRVPKSLGGLRQLQTLDVRGTSVVTLPSVIMKLEKLQYIRAGTIVPSHEWTSAQHGNIDGTSTQLEDMTTELPAGTDELQTSTLNESHDGMTISLSAAAYEIQASTPLERMTAELPAGTDELQTSTPFESRDGMTISLLAAADEIQASTPLEGMTADLVTDRDQQMSTPLEGRDGMTISLPNADEIQASTQLEGHDVTTTSMPIRSHEVLTSTCSPASAFVSLLSKFRGGRQIDSSVEISAGIGKLKALHTLGVVNVSGAGGKAILNELKMLTQLRKLRLSGINSGNMKELCSVISGHRHLESLSLRIDKGKDGRFLCLDDLSQPPKTLRSLKLYGHVHGLPVWMKQLDNLRKLDLEMTILPQDDLSVIDELTYKDILHRLCLKPAIQDGLPFNIWHESPTHYGCTFNLWVLKLDCSSSIHIIFDRWITCSVELLIVHCSRGSCVRISGLDYLPRLKEVWLKGWYDDVTKQDLQRQIDGRDPECTKAVLILEKPPSSL
ncbi:disease resistance protein PIK6-NP-like [Lolium rigidum]|uniref:disease resistance protein PIK6-NP-like n=1 Tax=Lolium rigidum TaxID=89674 RepID=UPI001F5DF78D|nr:disease resistance protein PIK6-NP-like [Lolium rigidum]